MSKQWFRVKIDDVLEIPVQNHESELKKLKQNEYVLVYEFKAGSRDLHTVYVDKYNESAKIVKCINSHGPKDQRPKIGLQDIVKLYRVTCTAVDVDTSRVSGLL